MEGLNPNWLPGKAVESTRPIPSHPAAMPLYNYGRCLPWHQYGSTSAYRLAAALIENTCEIGGRTWELEMAMRDVRIANTVAERDTANEKLRALIHNTHVSMQH